MKHMVHLYTEDPKGISLDEIRSVVNDWVSDYNERVDDTITHEPLSTRLRRDENGTFAGILY